MYLANDSVDSTADLDLCAGRSKGGQSTFSNIFDVVSRDAKASEKCFQNAFNVEEIEIFGSGRVGMDIGRATWAGEQDAETMLFIWPFLIALLGQVNTTYLE